MSKTGRKDWVETMGKIRKAVSILGVLFTFSAIALLLQPGMISQIPEISSVLRNAIVWSLMGLLGMYALKAFRIKPLDSSKLYLTSEKKPESVEDEDADLSFGLDSSPFEVRETVRRVLMRQHGVSGEEAESMIENGGWTDNSLSAAFIEESLRYPVLERLRAWLEDSGTAERRLKKTIEDVEELHRRDRI